MKMTVNIQNWARKDHRLNLSVNPREIRERKSNFGNSIGKIRKRLKRMEEKSNKHLIMIRVKQEDHLGHQAMATN